MNATEIWVKDDFTATVRNMLAVHNQHDSLYHRDIYNLEIDRKLAHLTLHLTKYCGRGIRNVINAPAFTVREEIQNVVDTISVLLSLSNAIGWHNWERASLRGSLADNTTNYWLQMTVLNGDLAKAVESRDHLEALDARQKIDTTVQRMLHLTMSLVRRSLGPRTMVDDYIKRIRSVEDKMPLVQQVHGTIDDGYRRENV